MDYLGNFRRHWPQQLTHAAIGTFAGILLTVGFPAAGAAILGMVLGRQALEYHKWNDDVGIDMAWYVGSTVAGAAIGLLINANY